MLVLVIDLLSLLRVMAAIIVVCVDYLLLTFLLSSRQFDAKSSAPPAISLGDRCPAQVVIVLYNSQSLCITEGQ